MTAGPSRPLLDLDPSRPPVTPVDAATLVLIRDAARGLEVFCVQRAMASGFMAGAIVFPGGRVEPDDANPAWDALVLPASERLGALAEDAIHARALAIAACRECVEEAAILPVDVPVAHDDVVALRDSLTATTEAFRDVLRARDLRLNLQALVPFARWVTPAAERRRFDARFFMMRAPAGQEGMHDRRETTGSFWATPAELLERWDSGIVQLAPPTHHTLWTLSLAKDVDDALAAAGQRPLDRIEPHLVSVDDTWALTLPGDPAHPRAERLLTGATRYVHRGEQWRPESH